MPAVDFEVSCPNNHGQTISFTQKSFEAALQAGEPIFHCNTCEADWNPSKKQIAEIREKLGEK